MITALKSLAIGLTFLLVSTLSHALTHPLPENLIPLESKEGQQLLHQSTANQDFFSLVRYFETQKTLTYCAVASGAIILNVLQITPPHLPSHYPYSFFTQENFFTENVSINTNANTVKMIGMTLDQLAYALKKHNVKVTLYRPARIKLAKFREILTKTLNNPDQFIIANYDREIIGQVGGGHMSPLAAYDKKSDHVLLLDVARYKYPSVWVDVNELWLAMKSMDEPNQKSRGFLIVENKGDHRPRSKIEKKST